MSVSQQRVCARREVFTAKKLDEVRAQAEAELGMIPSTITGGGLVRGAASSGRAKQLKQLWWFSRAQGRGAKSELFQAPPARMH